MVDDALVQWRKKDWKNVSMQKVVTLNTCCNVACLTFTLPFQPVLFNTTIISRKTKGIGLYSDEQVLHSTRHLSHVLGKFTVTVTVRSILR